MSYMPSDITWSGNTHTRIGTIPTGLQICLEQSGTDVYVEINGEPIMDVFESMEAATEFAETQAMTFMRNINPAELMNAHLEGLMA